MIRAGVLVLLGLAALACRREQEAPASAETQTHAKAVVASKQLSTALATGVSPALQRQVAFTLGSAGDAAAVEPLKAVLAQQDADVQLYAYDSLRKLGDRGVSGAEEAAAAYAGPKPGAPLEPPDA